MEGEPVAELPHAAMGRPGNVYPSKAVVAQKLQVSQRFACQPLSNRLMVCLLIAGMVQENSKCDSFGESPCDCGYCCVDG